MADDEPHRRQDTDAGNSNDDLMDIDMDAEFAAAAMDSDDEEFHLADDINGAVGPAVVNLPLPPPPVGPLRAYSQDRVRFIPSPAYLFNGQANRFSQSYRVLSARHLESRGHTNLESGGKVILPPDALEILSRNSSALMRPMMFKASNPSNNKLTHCGVLEFIAEENTCYMPSWMMDSLDLHDTDLIQIERVELSTATFAKFQPQSVDFLEISDPRAVLENTLRFFACLTKGDMITIHYNSRMYKMLVLETEPNDAVTIIECDMNVDFAAPVGYVSPSTSDVEDMDEGPERGNSSYFGGTGNRLNGKAVDKPAGSSRSRGKTSGSGGGRRIAPDAEWEIGKLQFKRKFKGKRAAGKENEGARFTAFGGTGLSLKKKGNDDLSQEY